MIVHEFLIKPKGIDTLQQFQFEVTSILGGISIVSNIQNNNFPLVSRKGLYYFMIEYAYHFVGENLYSSTNSENHKLLPNEFITPDAQKIWESLSSEGKAIFSNSNFRYKYI